MLLSHITHETVKTVTRVRNEKSETLSKKTHFFCFLPDSRSKRFPKYQLLSFTIVSWHRGSITLVGKRYKAEKTAT